MALGMVRQAFSKEHGRDPTKEEEERMAAAVGRDDPTDAHLGPVEAEEADACREITRAAFKSGVNREPTDEELSKKTDTLARAFRRAALEAVSDIETARRELVRRAVEAERTRDPFVVLRRVEAERRESERRIEPPPAPARAASDTTSDLEIARALSREDDAALAASLQAEEAAAASLPRPPP